MKYELNPNYPQLKELIENVETHFQQSNTILYDQRNQIRVISFKGEEIVIKSFKVPNAINKLVYRFFRPSKAKRSYLYSLKIGKALCPEPIAYIEKGNALLLGKSYYLSKFYQYDYTIEPLLDDDDFAERELILTEFADFTYVLHEQNILHRDYSHGNILVKNVDGKYQFKIIDVNRMQFRELSIDDRMDNFSRLKPNDKALEIILKQYAKRVNQPADELLAKAIKFRDDYAKQRALKNKLRGKPT